MAACSGKREVFFFVPVQSGFMGTISVLLTLVPPVHWRGTFRI